MLVALLLWLAATPSPAELLTTAIAKRDAQADRKFTYREDREQWEASKDGPLKRTKFETYDVIMLEGENYRKLVLVNGQPLDAKRQKQVDEALEKTRANRRRKFALIRRNVRVGTLADLKRLFDCTVTGEELVNGRKTWRMEAEPKPNYKPANADEQKMLNTRRTLWFDQTDGVEIKTVTLYTKTTDGFQPGTELETQFANSNGLWLADNLVFRFNLKAMAVVRIQGEARHRFYDYKLFQTDSKLIPE
jgi:hypothetical protein